MTVRYYSATAQETTLQVGINNSATVIQVAATTGFPVSLPYLLAIDYESSTEEVVLVTGAAGTSLTITRAYDGTSAAAHSSGARVRHVSSAIDFRDSRDHENSTDGVHGLGPTDTVVGEDATQTLNNKTLASPTITGTVAGSATYNTPTVSAGTLSGVTNASGQIKSSTAATADLAYTSKINTDTTNRFEVTEGGVIRWGPGGVSSTDSSLSRVGASSMALNADLSTLLVQVTGLIDTGNASIAGNLSVLGDLTVSGAGQVISVRKGSDTSRASTTTPTLDPELQFTLVAGNTYLFTCWTMLGPNTAGADFSATFGGTAIGTLTWSGSGGHNSITTGSQGDGEWIARDNVATPTPYAASQTAGVNLGVFMTGSYVCTTGGTFGLQWAQQTSNATATVVKAGSYLRVEQTS